MPLSTESARTERQKEHVNKVKRARPTDKNMILILLMLGGLEGYTPGRDTELPNALSM